MDKVDASPAFNPVFFRYFNRLIDGIAVLSVISILLVIFLQIISRWIGNSVAWTEEATRFLFMWMVFLGLGIGFRRAESPQVTVFMSLLPPSLSWIGKWIYVIASIGFFILMIVTGSDLVHQQIVMTEMASAFEVPMWIVGLAVPAGAVLGIFGIAEWLLASRQKSRHGGMPK